jgi:amidase
VRYRKSEKARPKIDSREAHCNYIQLLRGATVGRLTPEEFQEGLRASERLKPTDEGYEAQMLRAQAMYHKDWLTYNEERHKMRLAWDDFFHEYDLLLCPTATIALSDRNHDGLSTQSGG